MSIEGYNTHMRHHELTDIRPMNSSKRWNIRLRVPEYLIADGLNSPLLGKWHWYMHDVNTINDHIHPLPLELEV